jgi:hypothetical protein
VVRLTGGGERAERAAVEGPGRGQDDRAPAARAHQFDRGLDRFRSRGAQDAAPRRAGHLLGQRAPERLRVDGLVRLHHRRHAVAQGRLHRLAHRGRVVSEHDRAVLRVGIKEAPAGGVGEPRPLAAHEAAIEPAEGGEATQLGVVGLVVDGGVR